VAVAIEELERHQRVQKISPASRVQLQFICQLLPDQWTTRQFREDAELDGRQKNLRTPESQAQLHQRFWCDLGVT
jgi:hypothetical protein